MVKIGLADNHPVVHYGIKSYFKEHADISLVGIVDNFEMVEEMLKRKEIDVLLLDLELEGLSSINLIKALLKECKDPNQHLFPHRFILMLFRAQFYFEFI